MVCAIGTSSAERLIAGGIKPDVVGDEVGSESIVDAIEAKGPLSGRRVLIIRPDHLHNVVGDDLARRGAAVTDLVAYRTAAASADDD